MGDYLTALQFAEDLMKYAFHDHDIPWEIPEHVFFDKDRSPFTESVGEAVLFIICHRNQDITDCLRDLIDMGAKKADLFSRYAIEAAPQYFPEGYSPERFLCYCAMLVGVGRLLFEYPPNGIAECTPQVIGTVLTGHILTGEFKKQGGYQRISEVSKVIVKQLENINVNEES